MTDTDRPRMVYFMGRPDNYAVNTLEPTVYRIVKGLEQSFEVIIVNDDCDYSEICGTHEPAICLFECGSEAANSGYEIANLAGNLQIPRLGVMTGDPHSASRVRCLEQLERWRIDALFTQGDLSLKEYMSEIADDIFEWPVFIDSDLYRDYGNDRVIPVLFVGRCDGPALIYEWRQQIKKRVTPHYPSLVFPHPGYSKETEVPFVIHGEQYARTINASYFTPTCGDFLRIVLTKHLEIPAAKSCLITEKTPAIEAYGFADMENCVFANETDVIDKLEHLFNNRDQLDGITQNGFDLVHSRHTHKHRDHLLQWYKLHCEKRPGDRIIQKEPLGGLEIVEADSGEQSFTFDCQARDRELIRVGDELFEAGRFSDAEEQYAVCREFRPWIPEPVLRIAICRLHQGNPRSALSLIATLNRITFSFDSSQPDPVEWAFLLIALICSGKNRDAKELSSRFPDLSCNELRWTRRLLDALDDRSAGSSESDVVSRPDFPSIHTLPTAESSEFTQSVTQMLRSCGRKKSAKRVEGVAVDVPAAKRSGGQASDERSIENIPAIMEQLARFRCETPRQVAAHKYHGLKKIAKQWVGR